MVSCLKSGVILDFISAFLAVFVAGVGFGKGAASELVSLCSKNFNFSWQLPLILLIFCSFGFNWDVLGVGGRGVILAEFLCRTFLVVLAKPMCLSKYILDSILMNNF